MAKRSAAEPPDPLTMRGGDPAAARFVAAAAAAAEENSDAKRPRLEKVPVVDLAPFFAADASEVGQEAVASQVARACEEVGFFVITGHGVDVKLMKDCASAGRTFFARPEEEKAEVAAGGRAYGFFPVTSEALGYNADVAKRPDLREAFSMGPQAPPPPGARDRHPEVVDFCYQETPWPRGGALKEAMAGYYDAVGKLADGLLRIFARALKVDADFFHSKTTHHASSLRVIHYPKIHEDPSPGQLRCGEHSDICTMTILWQDVHGGLEVLPRGHNEWVEVSCPADGLVVNLGDLFARWTNDRWLSTPHRVVCPRVDDEVKNVPRISMPYFQIINSDAEVRCIESCLGLGDKPKYDATTQGEDLMGHFKRWGRNRGD